METIKLMTFKHATQRGTTLGRSMMAVVIELSSMAKQKAHLLNDSSDLLNDYRIRAES